MLVPPGQEVVEDEVMHGIRWWLFVWAPLSQDSFQHRGTRTGEWHDGGGTFDSLSPAKVGLIDDFNPKGQAVAGRREVRFVPENLGSLGSLSIVT
jgi:hypothetical protein